MLSLDRAETRGKADWLARRRNQQPAIDKRLPAWTIVTTTPVRFAGRAGRAETGAALFLAFRGLKHNASGAIPLIPTNVYVDGFNLYFGALRGRAYKWLDLLTLSRRLLKPWNTVTRVRYFTAKVLPSPHNPRAPERQRAYLRALATIPNLSVHYGRFQMIPGQPPREKGSDVNLASYLLLDAFDREYRVALVISNDSDLTHPIELVRERFGVRVGVAPPVLGRGSDSARRRPSRDLHRQPTSLSRSTKRSGRYSVTHNSRTLLSTVDELSENHLAGKRSAPWHTTNSPGTSPA